MLVIERESVCNRTKFFLYLPLSTIHSFYFTFSLLLHTVSLSLSLSLYLTHTLSLYLSLLHTLSSATRTPSLYYIAFLSLPRTHFLSTTHTFLFVYSREKESVSVCRKGSVCSSEEEAV